MIRYIWHLYLIMQYIVQYLQWMWCSVCTMWTYIVCHTCTIVPCGQAHHPILWWNQTWSHIQMKFCGCPQKIHIKRASSTLTTTMTSAFLWSYCDDVSHIKTCTVCLGFSSPLISDHTLRLQSRSDLGKCCELMNDDHSFLDCTYTSAGMLFEVACCG